MGVTKQTVLFTLVYNDEEIYAKSGAEALSHELFNVDGMIEWDLKVLKEEKLSADITDEDLESLEEE